MPYIVYPDCQETQFKVQPQLKELQQKEKVSQSLTRVGYGSCSNQYSLGKSSKKSSEGYLRSPNT